MIPKIIHYCWFGSRTMPQDVQDAIMGWKKKLPDYTIIEWNEGNYDVSSCVYSREAYDTGNYAFVSDVCRLHALYKMGGIYLDTDIEVLCSFDPFLYLPSFLGYEHKGIGTGVIGAEAGCSWIGMFLEYYHNRHFINMFGHCVRTPNTKIFMSKIYPAIPVEWRPEVFSKDVFCAKNWESGEIEISPDTVCIHHYAGSWRYNKSHGIIPKLREMFAYRRLRR